MLEVLLRTHDGSLDDLTSLCSLNGAHSWRPDILIRSLQGKLLQLEFFAVFQMIGDFNLAFFFDYLWHPPVEIPLGKC